MKTSVSVPFAAKSWFWSFTAVLCIAFLVYPELAVAQAMPYEDGLDMLEESFRGPVPTVISLAGIVGCGAMLIFGGEISGFMRTMVFIVLVVAVLVQATNIIDLLRA